MSDPSHPHILGRYVHDAERHEQIAMSFYPPGTGGYPEPVASYSNHPPHHQYSHSPEQQYPNSDAPMNRYLTDLLAYEQLAMALRAEQQGYNPQDHPELYEYTTQEGFSLSISNGPDFDEEEYYEERAEEEEGPVIEQIKLYFPLIPLSPTHPHQPKCLCVLTNIAATNDRGGNSIPPLASRVCSRCR